MIAERFQEINCMCFFSRCFENAKDVFPHVYKVHLNPNGAGVCQWDVCDRLVRQKFSLCTHVQVSI
jgi:hypothetical protein